MFVKGIALTALVASTPLALFATQEPRSGQQPKTSVVRPVSEPSRAETQGELRRSRSDLDRARRQLEAARKDVKLLRQQLDAALDRLDTHYPAQRERNCAPSRSRALMSHYQWLRDQGHSPRAHDTLARVVDRVGNDVGRLNSVAWDLMTDKATAGKFDEVALAMTERMLTAAKKSNRSRKAKLHYNHLDTVALAYFLNGDVEKAVDMQRQVIESGGNNDDFRRRLRTYEAAQTALAKARTTSKLPAATMVASNNEEDEE